MSYVEHVVQRAKERYGVDLTPADVADIEERIRMTIAFRRADDGPGAKHGIWRARAQVSDGKVYGETWKATVRGVEMRIVWAPAKDRIATVLWPPMTQMGPALGKLGAIARITRSK